jgi:glycosyltransferase involved in cell wall biosynthesis
MLDRITPVILTFNEEPNIARLLSRLTWAKEIVVCDSYSNDGTVEIARSFSNVRLIQRKFDLHATQWNYATFDTGITSDWILALDADYIIPDEAVVEISGLDADGPIDGYTAFFHYCILGKQLRGTLYPPVTVLFRRENGKFFQDGHTQRLRLEGGARKLEYRFLHDDRKSLSHWLLAQDRYMRLEAKHIEPQPWSHLRLADKVRAFPPVAPFAVFAYCYFFKLGILDGKAGLYYALQRLLAEALLGLRMIEKSISPCSSRLK